MGSESATMAIMTSHYQIGAALTMLLAGDSCESDLGWPAVFFLLGLLSITGHLLFSYFYIDEPIRHRWRTRHLTVQAHEQPRAEEDQRWENGAESGGISSLSKATPESNSVVHLGGVHWFLSWLPASCTIWSHALCRCLRFSPSFSLQIWNVSPAVIGITLGAARLLSLCVRLLAGFWSRKWPRGCERIRMLAVTALSQVPSSLDTV